MRDEFRAIVSGWTLVCDPESIAERLHELEALAPYSAEEERYIAFMIRTQVAQGFERGDFSREEI